MKTGCVVAVTLALIGGPRAVQADDTDGSYLTYRWQCARLNEAIRTGQPNPDKFDWYIDGYVTYYNNATGHTYALTKDFQDAVNWVINYCKQNPKADSNEALKAMIAALGETRIQTKDAYQKAQQGAVPLRRAPPPGKEPDQEPAPDKE